MTAQERRQNVVWFGVPNPTDYEVTGERIQLNPLPLRAVATGAILFFNGNQPIKQLCRLKPECHMQHRLELAEWWDIRTPADARQRLTRLVEVGHRATIQPQLVQNEAYWRPLFDRNDFLRGRPVTSVAAWDYCRIVNLAYWTRDVGLIDDDTAFGYFDAGAQLAYERFTSWEELAVSFLAGRMMWRPDDNEGHEWLSKVAAYLLETDYNVWRECPWDNYQSWRKAR